MYVDPAARHHSLDFVEAVLAFAHRFQQFFLRDSQFRPARTFEILDRGAPVARSR